MEGLDPITVQQNTNYYNIHQERVNQFMFRAKQSLPLTPAEPSEEVLKLRVRLIIEEVFELITAMGMVVSCDTPAGEYLFNHKKSHVYKENQPFNMVEVADGLADASVVLYGTASACGINMAPLLEEVDYNNLAKFKDGYRIREDGKVLKSPLHVPPDIKKVLFEQSWEDSAKEEESDK